MAHARVAATIKKKKLLHSIIQHWKVIYFSISISRYAVAEWYEAGLYDREVAGSTPARGCCVPTPTQRAIPPGSVNE